jgi:hypothetical protein
LRLPLDHLFPAASLPPAIFFEKSPIHVRCSRWVCAPQVLISANLIIEDTATHTDAVTGGVIGLLAGIGALAIPDIGPFIAAGPIMAALSGAAVGAATGGVVGGLIGLGIPEIEAKRYDEKLKKGITWS